MEFGIKIIEIGSWKEKSVRPPLSYRPLTPTKVFYFFILYICILIKFSDPDDMYVCIMNGQYN